MRLDAYLSARHGVTRTKAKQMIERGMVRVNGEAVLRPACDVGDDDEVIVEKFPEYASFGGEKLAKALFDFSFSVKGLTCADIGASNGGFTSCLLQNGAAKVYAIDVGECAFDNSLKNDPRVIVKDRTNARYLTKDTLGEKCDFACIDVSFISLELILPAAAEIIKDGGHIIALIKPQFEVGKKALSKRGIVTSEKERYKAADKVRAAAENCGLEELGFTVAPIRANKNIEFLILFCKK